MSRKTNRDVAAKLEALYQQLPTLRCRQLCGVACGPIPMTIIEADRLRRAAHREPHTTGPRGTTCGYLRDGRCTVYQARPFICRSWGVVKRMSCMHGCEPDRWLTDHEFVHLAQQIERLGGRLVVTTPDGLAVHNDSFLRLDLSTATPEDAEHDAERVRGLRALHGGLIIGVHRGPTINFDEPGDRERLREARRKGHW